VNFFKLYIGDYQRDTAHLSIAEHGAYMLMLQHYYATEKPLPSGKALHRMLRAQDKTEREAIDNVAAQFWLSTEDGLVNDRADVEITKAAAQADTNARIAREREDRRKASRKPDEQGTNRATNDQPNHSQTPDTSSPSLRSGESADKPRTPRKRREETNLETYLKTCKSEGLKPLPADHAIRDYCRDAGISDEMLQVAWCVFRDDYLTDTIKKAKRYKDWPGHFANAVRGGWYKLWYTDSAAGCVAWTSRGLQEKAVLDARARAKETTEAA